MSERPVDAQSYKSALSLFCSGVTVITVRAGRIVHGMTATAFASVSLHPARILVCIGNHTRMKDLMQRGDRFGVSVLSHDQAAVAAHFAGQPTGNDVELGEYAGMPIVPGALAHLVSRVESLHVEGDHTIYVGCVIACRAATAPPLLYFAGGYRRLDDYDPPMKRHPRLC